MSQRSYPQHDYSRPAQAIEIVLVRHGASAAAFADEPFELLEGQADPPLSPAGERQARLVAKRLSFEPIGALFVTPLQRTAQTAAPYAANSGLEPLVVADLREIFLGELDGGAFRIAVADGDPRIPEVFAQQRWDVIPGAESMAAFAQRTRAGVETILDGRQPGDTVAAVVHGGVIGELCRQATGASPFAFVHADNGSLTRLVVLDSGRWLLRSFNETGHLIPSRAV